VIDCWQYNLTENINACFVENYWQTWDFWKAVAILIVIAIIAWYISIKIQGEPG